MFLQLPFGQYFLSTGYTHNKFHSKTTIMKQFKTKLPEIQLSYRRGTETIVKIKSAEDAYKVFRTRYDEHTIDYIECSFVLFLNRANNTIGWMKLSQGGTCTTIMDPKVLFVTALKCGASAVIISHNHPSGELVPSEQDKVVTKKIKDIGQLLDIKVLDHLIITSEGFYSFANEGLM